MRATLAAVAASALATALVWTLPFARFAYRGPALHVALETAASLTALLVAYLVFLRFRRRGSLSDLMLFAALAVLAATNTLFSALPSALGQAPGTFSTWAPVGGRLLSAVLLVAAAFAPDTPVRRPGRAVAAIAGFGAALGLIAAGVLLLGSRLPVALDPDLSPEASVDPVIAGHPIVLLVQIVLVLLYAVAAAGFMRSAQAKGDELLAWFALAAVLGAFARVNYFLFPSLYSNWVYTGDGFRLGFHVALLLGAAREIRAYQREAGALRERRRVARDLHDGLAHELAFVAAQSRRLASEGASPSALRELQTAAERALDLSRDAITALTRPTGDELPLDLVVRQAARDVAERVGVALDLVADPDVHAGREVREALVPIVREAVTNAVRHGHADRVTIELRRDGRLRLRIADDGTGFARSAAPGFGLTSMRERAAAAGGELTLASGDGHGTVIEVVLP
jgi:signal transduction histidine kinase